MNKSLVAVTIIAIAALIAVTLQVLSHKPEAYAQGISQPACSFPASLDANANEATQDQTAWEIFIAANCKASSGALVWETWIEQSDLYPTSGQGECASRTLAEARAARQPRWARHSGQREPMAAS